MKPGAYYLSDPVEQDWPLNLPFACLAVALVALAVGVSAIFPLGVLS
jgi:hypothetical protein